MSDAAYSWLSTAVNGVASFVVLFACYMAILLYWRLWTACDQIKEIREALTWEEPEDGDEVITVPPPPPVPDNRKFTAFIEDSGSPAGTPRRCWEWDVDKQVWVRSGEL